MTDTAPPADAAAARRDALVERLFLATVGTWDVLAVYLGDRLGLYRLLSEHGPMSSGELAGAAGMSERHVRDGSSSRRRAASSTSTTRVPVPALAAVPAVHERLPADPPARVADVACGEGRSTIAIARGYPNVRVAGIDLDAASIEAARRQLAGSAVPDRVAFHERDAADEELAGSHDLVYIHEARHDMSYPVRVLEACGSLLADGGSVIVGDERVPDSFDPPGDEVERFYHGFSILHCLPVGMIGEGAAGTGTVMRAGTVREYAERAGFGGFEVLAIENDFYRFYRLVP